MSDIAIACNHDYISSVGGCEKVVQQIATKLSGLGHKCFVFSNSYSKFPIAKDNVGIQNCGKSYNQFCDHVNKINPDFLLIYSDFFIFLPPMLAQPSKIKAKKILFPVGLNNILSSSIFSNLFIKNHSEFKVIAHSEKYTDFIFCKQNNIPVEIIPNGVDFEEFSPASEPYFREKYGFDIHKKLFSNVSNFFPGKGQEILPKILFDIKSNVGDIFEMVFICSSSQIGAINRIRERFYKTIKSCDFQCKILVDIPRKDVVQSFFESDLFLFPSQKEVAPLVIIEAMAAGLPWVSFDVGNVSELLGGTIIKSSKDKSGFIIFDSLAKNLLHNAIMDCCKKYETKNTENKNRIIEETKNKYNWDKIKLLYHKLFT